MLPNRTFSIRMGLHPIVNIHALAALLWCVTVFAPAASADGPLEVVGQWGGGSWSVLADGEFAYAGVGPNLYVLNISDPAHPVRVASLRLTDRLYEIHKLDQYLVIANGRGGLQIVDVSNPLAPQRVAALSDRPCRSVAISGSTAYLFDQYVRVVDIADPASPTVLGEVATGLYSEDLEGGFFQIAAGAAGVAYFGGPTGLSILDARNPAQPAIVRTIVRFGTAQAARVVDGRLVVAFEESLGIFDLADPVNPALLGSLDGVLFYPYTMAIDGTTAYVAHVSVGPALIDISDPSAPRFIAEIDTNAYTIGMSAHAERLFVADYDGGVYDFDVSDPAQPRQVGRFGDSAGRASAIAVVSDRAYVAMSGGLHAFDVTSAAAPILVATHNYNFAPASDIAVARNHLYICHTIGDIEIVNISDPSHMTGVSWPVGLLRPRAIAMGEHFGFIVGHGTWLDLMAIRLSEPDDPEPVGGCPLIDNAIAADFPSREDDDYLYVATRGELAVVSTRVWYSPLEVATLHAYPLRDVAVDDNFAYLASSTIHVVDIADPLNPEIVGSVARRADLIEASGRYVLAVDNAADELLLIDGRYPAAPRIAATIATNGDTGDVKIQGSLAYLADGEGGLLIVRLPDPADFNFDGHVDTSDLTTLLSNFGIPAGAAYWQGDVDDDGDVDLSDLVSLLGEFGQ